MQGHCAEFAAEQIHHYPFHVDDRLRIFYVLKGSIRINNVSGKVILHEGDIEFVSIREPAELLGLTEDNLVLSICIDRDYLAKLNPNIDYLILNVGASQFFPSIERHLTPQNLYNTKHLKLMFTDLYLEALTAPNQLINEKNLEVFCQFFIEHFNDIKKIILCLPHTTEHMIKRFQRIDLYLQQHLSERVRLDTLVKSEGLTSQYLSAEIKNKYNRTFSNILEYYRMTAAVRMMIRGTTNIREITECCGFSDDKYFYKAWKSLFGGTPSSFRKKLLDDGPVITRFQKITPEQLSSIRRSEMPDHPGKPGFTESAPGYYIAPIQQTGFARLLRCMISDAFSGEFLLTSDEIWFFHSGDALPLSVRLPAERSFFAYTLAKNDIPDGGPSLFLPAGAVVTRSPGHAERPALISRVMPISGENQPEHS